MRFLVIIAAAGLVAGSAFGIVARSATAGNPRGVETTARHDTGSGERLLLVVAGEYATRAEAEAANARIVIGDVAGFVVAPAADFEGLPAGRYLVLSAFRTVKGAAEFEELLRVAGNTATQRILAVYRGSSWIGLGQEPNPDGTGPLLGPLAPGHPDRL
ncbi:MAG TPA: hypothetical protein VGB64_14640 [Actinomycetota bacterium]